MDARHALGAFPVSVDTSQGWVVYRLELPEKRGIIECTIESYERVVVLYRPAGSMDLEQTTIRQLMRYG